jgi:hypothetical protein
MWLRVAASKAYVVIVAGSVGPALGFDCCNWSSANSGVTS